MGGKDTRGYLFLGISTRSQMLFMEETEQTTAQGTPCPENLKL